METNNVRLAPLICVHDVPASSTWYQRLLGCTSGHGGDEYEQIVRDGEIILQLHAWDVDHHHGPMGDASASVGNGVLLWFEVDDFDAAAARAHTLGALVVLDVHRNPNANHRELWIRDPDGYLVVIASPDGDSGGVS